MSQATNTELLPCPFCGGELLTVPNDIAGCGNEMGIPGLSAFYSHCEGCGMDGPVGENHGEAIELSNRRATQASAEPVAYAAFADNGNIRIWTSVPDDMCKLAEAEGLELVPLYRAAPSSAPTPYNSQYSQFGNSECRITPSSAPSTEPAGRDWPEDRAQENGQYENKCSGCGNSFIGNKHRRTCKACYSSPERAPSTDSAGEVIARGYECGTMTGDPTGLGATIKLHYESPPEAEAAFEAITDLIAAMQPQGAGGQNE